MIGMTVCSGIGAPEVAAPWIDWRYQSEIEPFPCAVLAERFPDAVNLGDMTKFKEWPNANVDVLCGGTPCQAFSVAGLRKGLADPRGNLMLTYLAIAARYRPRWLVWENVPGVLSSNGGRDFGAFLGGLGELGYGFSYRVLDVQFGRTLRFPFAIPQRRRRVFVVGYLGDWRRAAAVLFDRESLSGNPPPRREAGQIAAPTLGARASSSGIPSVAHSLRAQGQLSHREDQDTLIPETAGTLRAEGFDASEDGPGRQTLIPSHDPACTLTARDYKGPLPEADLSTVVVAFSCKDNGRDATDGIAPTMRSMNGERPNGGGQLAVAFDPNQVTSKANRSIPRSDVCHTIPATTTPPHLAAPWAVRRLTPTECERLMGFPDGWTKIPYRGKPADKCPDGPRYKALGNSWGVNAGEYVFDRIRMVEGLA